MSHFWCPEFLGGFQIFGKYVHHMYIYMFSNIISLHTRRNMPFVKKKGIVQEDIEWLAL